MAGDILFYRGGELRLALQAQALKLVEEIEVAPEDHLLHIDEDEWVAALVDRWSVEAPVLHPEDMWVEPPADIKVDVAHDWMRAVSDRSRPALIAGQRITVHIPFSGEADVFKLKASTFSTNPPYGEVGNGELLDVIEHPSDSHVDYRAHAMNFVADVERYLTWSRNDIEVFNSGLEQMARQTIGNRRRRVQNTYDRLRESGIPMRRPGGDSAKTYIADVVVRRPAPILRTTPGDRPMPLEPVLADEVFDHILWVVRDLGQNMERSPKVYAEMGEEDLRQTILATLNTHYRGQATAEAFNVSGKTDILVRYENQNLFIAECKFWSGKAGFSETVDQLFRYRAWRDTKLAIVMFVRERDLTSIVERAHDELATHQQFIEWRDAATETELRCVMSWLGDDRRRADLNVFFVHLPKT
jgi:hypothetical protein